MFWREIVDTSIYGLTNQRYPLDPPPLLPPTHPHPQAPTFPRIISTSYGAFSKCATWPSCVFFLCWGRSKCWKYFSVACRLLFFCCIIFLCCFFYTVSVLSGFLTPTFWESHICFWKALIHFSTLRVNDVDLATSSLVRHKWRHIYFHVDSAFQASSGFCSGSCVVAIVF